MSRMGAKGAFDPLISKRGIIMLNLFKKLKKKMPRFWKSEIHQSRII